MPLGHTLANNRWRDEEIRSEKRKAAEASDIDDSIRSFGLGLGGAIAGGTAGAVHKERALIERAKQGIARSPLDDAVFSRRAHLGAGLGALAGIGIGRLAESENPERDAHRARIKELRGMDHDELLKERSRSMHKRASEVEDDDFNARKYRRQEVGQARRDAWGSQSDKEERRMIGGMVAGAGLGLLGAGGMANVAAKLKGEATHPLAEALRRDKLNAFTGTMNGSVIGGLTSDLFRDPDNTERMEHEERMRAVKRMTDDELHDDYLSKQANEARDYRNNEIRHAQLDAKDSMTNGQKATHIGGALAGSVAGLLGGAKIKRISDKRSSLAHLATKGDAITSNRAILGSLAGGMAGGAVAGAVEPKSAEREGHKQRIRDLASMSDAELLADKANKMNKQASDEYEPLSAAQYRRQEARKAQDGVRDSITDEEKKKRIGGYVAGSIGGALGGGAINRAKLAKRYGWGGPVGRSFASKEGIIGSMIGGTAGNITGGMLSEANPERDKHKKRLNELTWMSNAELLADQQANMHKAAHTFYALQEK